MKRKITNILIISVLMLLAGFQAASALTYTVQVPAKTDVVYIVGDPTGDWSTFVEMQRVDETTFSITLDNATTDMNYEYCAGPGWAYEEIDANGKGVSRFWTELDIAYDFTAYFVSGTLTYTAQVPPEVKALYVTGDFNNWNSFIKMNRIDDNTFSVNVKNAGSDMGYQYCAGPGWAYQEVDANGDALGRTGGGGVDVAEYFMDYFTPTQLTYTVQVPDGVNEVYIVGDAVGGWDRFIKMQRVGNENKFSITLDDVDESMGYEYCAGPSWNYEECDENGDVYGLGPWSELDNVVGFVDIFDPNSPTALTYTVKVPAETNVVYYEFDGGGGWMNYAEMQRVDANTFSIAFEATADMGYAYCAGPSEDYREIDASGNVVWHNQWTELDTAFGFLDYDYKLGSFTGIVNPSPLKTGLICSSVNHIITVTGIFDEVSIYNITGQKLQSEIVTNHFESKPLNSGVYLVKAGKQVEKVLVK